MESPDVGRKTMSKPEERRKFPRLRREERVVIRKMDNTDEDPANNVLYCKTVDISAAGFQARAKKELHPGEHVDVVINVEGYGDSFHLSGEIRWCRPAQEDDAYLLGVEITDADRSDFVPWRRIFN
ncbi:MAG: PilZ domain-containing protein [Gammaproteobacteria bacterium]